MPTVKQRRVSGQYIPDNFLAIRYDNGRILTNRQDYMNYLANKYSDDCEYHRNKYRVSFGDASYVPYHQTDDGEIILYDFNMEVGDGYLHVEGYDDVYVTETDSVALTDGKHKRLTLNNGLVLIEGIGCINSPGMLFDYLNPSPFIKTEVGNVHRLDIAFEGAVIVDVDGAFRHLSAEGGLLRGDARLEAVFLESILCRSAEGDGQQEEKQECLFHGDKGLTE